MPILDGKCSVNREAVVDFSIALHICIYRRDNFKAEMTKAVRTWRSYRAEAWDPQKAVLYSDFYRRIMWYCLAHRDMHTENWMLFFSRSLTIYIHVKDAHSFAEGWSDDLRSIPSHKYSRYFLKWNISTVNCRYEIELFYSRGRNLINIYWGQLPISCTILDLI